MSEIPPMAQESTPDPLPWETPGTGLGGWFSTIGMFFAQPGNAFARVPASRSIARAFVYGAILFFLAQALEALYGFAIAKPMTAFVPPEMKEQMEQQLAASRRWIPWLLVGSPVIFAAAGLVIGGIAHGLLLMTGGAKGGFVTTFRVYGYAMTPLLLAAIPVCGGLAGWIWCVVLLVIGLSRAHAVSTGRAVLAVLVPVGAVCLIRTIFVMIQVAGQMSKMGNL